MFMFIWLISEKENNISIAYMITLIVMNMYLDIYFIYKIYL